jgi:Uri superfamily endonuclease
MRPDRAELGRFFSHVRVADTGCWEWTGSRNRGGYGLDYSPVTRTIVAAHRVSCRWFVGDIPERWHVDHLCCNPPCVNPAHLEPVTARENTQRFWRQERDRRAPQWRAQRLASAVQHATQALNGRVIRASASAHLRDCETEFLRREVGTVIGRCNRHGWRAVRDGGSAPECPLCAAEVERTRDIHEFQRRVLASF